MFPRPVVYVSLMSLSLNNNLCCFHYNIYGLGFAKYCLNSLQFLRNLNGTRMHMARIFGTNTQAYIRHIWLVGWFFGP